MDKLLEVQTAEIVDTRGETTRKVDKCSLKQLDECAAKLKILEIGKSDQYKHCCSFRNFCNVSDFFENEEDLKKVDTFIGKIIFLIYKRRKTKHKDQTKNLGGENDI